MPEFTENGLPMPDDDKMMPDPFDMADILDMPDVPDPEIGYCQECGKAFFSYAADMCKTCAADLLGEDIPDIPDMPDMEYCQECHEPFFSWGDGTDLCQTCRANLLGEDIPDDPTETCLVCKVSFIPRHSGALQDDGTFLCVACLAPELDILIR